MIRVNFTHKKPAVNTAGFLVLTLGLLFFQCERQEKVQEKQLRPDTQTAGDTVVSNVNYEELMIQLLVMEERIKEAPEVVSLRQDMVNLSLDAENQEIYTMGIGLFPENAANTAVARQSAERAAFLDACRWAAYVMNWKTDPNSTPFGSIQGELPNAAIVLKSLSPDGTQAYALVKVGL